MRKIMAGVVLAVGVVGFLAASGCDVIKQAQSNQVMLAQLLSTPDESVAGKSVPGKVICNVFLGTRDPANLQAPPTPTTGAQVHIEFNGQSVNLNETGGGNYTATSGVTYTEGASYKFVAVIGSTTFAEDVTAPEKEEIAEFHQGALAPDAGISFDGGIPFFEDGGSPVFPDGGLDYANLPVLNVQAGQNLTLTRPPADGERNIALTVVTPVTDQGPQQPTFTDPPLDAQGLITVLVDPSKYQQNTVTVDGTKAWATCPPSDYLVTVTAMKKGTTEGTNLFLGSTALAGSADAAPAHCTP
ncbi:MAG: hypothetical protein JST54_29650 [Deltaproteobacteria bacterium]|nr:hypothetical protein [Deltaproteobacteria bacterium]